MKETTWLWIKVRVIKRKRAREKIHRFYHKVATATTSSFTNLSLERVSAMNTQTHTQPPHTTSTPRFQPPLPPLKGERLAACPACNDRLLFEAWLGEHMAGAPQQTHPQTPPPGSEANVTLCRSDWASCVCVFQDALFFPPCEGFLTGICSTDPEGQGLSWRRSTKTNERSVSGLESELRTKNHIKTQSQRKSTNNYLVCSCKLAACKHEQHRLP